MSAMRLGDHPGGLDDQDECDRDSRHDQPRQCRHTVFSGAGEPPGMAAGRRTFSFAVSYTFSE
jgi:hypothetical protein